MRSVMSIVRCWNIALVRDIAVIARSWLDIIKNKPQELFLAISDANKIVSYLEDKSLSKEQNISKEIEEMEMEYA